jgi:hypothetical protein
MDPLALSNVQLVCMDTGFTELKELEIVFAITNNQNITGDLYDKCLD